MAIGALLFATLMAIRRKEAAIRAAAPSGDAETERAGAAGAGVAALPTDTDGGSPSPEPVDLLPEMYSDAGEGSSPAEDEGVVAAAAPGVEETVEETPEWEPHAAARASESDDAQDIVTPEEPAEAEIVPSAEELPPETWSDPTPTAMGDAAAFDADVDDGIVPDIDSQTPHEDTADFASLQDDEPFATTSAEEPSTSFADAVDEDEPAAAEPSLAEVSAGVAADQTIPEEEPFERAGRWWFKRGSELLVYNEQTGEWVPSPTPLPEVEQPTPSRYGPDASVTQTISDITAAEPEPEPEPASDTASQPEIVEPTTQQGFWKCPACGAVNGSTAATCRMCFAARPGA